MTNALDFKAVTIDGEDRPLSEYRGRTLLVVNVASKCGYTRQYAGLQRLHESLRDRGVEVLGFPCNQFGGQEPGSEEDIKSFCSQSYGVTFPMFAKIDVNGPNSHPLYDWLTRQDTRPEGPGDIPWNFTKFIIGPDGDVKGRYSPKTEPDELANALTALAESRD
ncbi:MAG: glutathione peroxidase [Myxococcales bacterium]|nr:glutathione peroxidase [Myxococcales bacterium]